jgi:hypothetical protein
MPSPIISHLIGTTMLLLVMLTISFFFITFGTVIGIKAAESELNEVAEYLASNIVDLASLANASLSNVLLVDISFPYEVNGYGYAINITKETNSYIIITRIDYLNIEGKAILPWNTSQTIKIASSDPGINGIEYKNGLYSGMEKAVIWCKKNGEEIYIGLGIRK